MIVFSYLFKKWLICIEFKIFWNIYFCLVSWWILKGLDFFGFSFHFDLLFFFKYFIYLFLERGQGRKRGRETSVCSCLLCTPYWGPDPQPRRVPWPGIKAAYLSVCGRTPNLLSHTSQHLISALIFTTTCLIFFELIVYFLKLDT